MSDEGWKDFKINGEHPRIYQPFADNDAPEGWPTTFIALEDVMALAVERDEAAAVSVPPESDEREVDVTEFQIGRGEGEPLRFPPHARIRFPPHARINISEGIIWKDGNGQSWVPYEQHQRLRAERDRYRQALADFVEMVAQFEHPSYAKDQAVKAALAAARSVLATQEEESP